MTKDYPLQSTELWDAWIDLQSPDEQAAATLYVIADVMVSHTLVEPRLVKKNNALASSRELVLEITPNSLCEEGIAMEVLYAENLQDLNQYDVISVYAGNELIARIDEIELFF